MAIRAGAVYPAGRRSVQRRPLRRRNVPRRHGIEPARNGGLLALLGWIYAGSAILVLTGQFTWAFAMVRRGRGALARHAPREAGLAGWSEPFEQDNAVNEAHLL